MQFSISSKVGSGVCFVAYCVFRSKHAYFLCISWFYRKVIACAGIFRVLGQEVAELPLVATTTKYQKRVILFTSAMNLNLSNYLKLNRII